MFIVSDLRNGSYRISGMFAGLNAKQNAIRWAGSAGKITQLRSAKIFRSLHSGQALPKRYVAKA